MSVWDSYAREEEEKQEKVTGRLRCIITEVDEGISKSSGNPMITITVRPSGTKFKVKTWLVQNDNFNRNATKFFDAFPEIGEGNFNFVEWIGAEGAAMFDVNENGFLKVKYWIDADRAENLPPYEGERIERQTVTSLDDDEGGFSEDDDDDGIPF